MNRVRTVKHVFVCLVADGKREDARGACLLTHQLDDLLGILYFAIGQPIRRGRGAIIPMRKCNSDEKEQIEREEKDGSSVQEYLSR